MDLVYLPKRNINTNKIAYIFFANVSTCFSDFNRRQFVTCRLGGRCNCRHLTKTTAIVFKAEEHSTFACFMKEFRLVEDALSRTLGAQSLPYLPFDLNYLPAFHAGLDLFFFVDSRKDTKR